jgi:hypothetical protein
MTAHIVKGYFGMLISSRFHLRVGRWTRWEAEIAALGWVSEQCVCTSGK